MHHYIIYGIEGCKCRVTQAQTELGSLLNQNKRMNKGDGW